MTLASLQRNVRREKDSARHTEGREAMMTLSGSSIGSNAGDAPRKEPSRLTAMLMKWFFRSASIRDVETLSEHFRVITLAGDELKDVPWIPGQKVQIELGNGMRRTYTPISWDADTGVTRILVFLHGNGPSLDWASSLKPGDSCLFFGPRGSLDLSNLGLPALIFGDETSFGLAYAVKTMSELNKVTFLFEVSSIPEAQQVVQALGLTSVTLVQRSLNDSHMDAVEAAMSQAIEAHNPVQYVLTGKASSILRLRRSLKTRGISSAQLKVKAYWAVGQTGLD